MQQPDNKKSPFGEIPPLLWERWFLEECSPEELSTINSRSTPEQRQQVTELLAASNQQLLGLYPPERVTEQLSWQLHRLNSRERQQKRLSRRYFWFALPSASAAALLALWVTMDPTVQPQPTQEPAGVEHYLGGNSTVPTEPQPTPPGHQESTQQGPDAAPGQLAPAAGNEPEVRVKGDPRLLLYRQKGQEAEELPDFSPANAGDRIQVEYLAAGKSHGVVLSVDGRENVTLHFPQSPNAGTALLQGEAQPLAHSYELDDAPDFETFYFVTANRPLDVGLVIRAFQSHLEGSPLTLEDDCMLYRITLKKPDLPENGDGNVH